MAVFCLKVAESGLATNLPHAELEKSHQFDSSGIEEAEEHGEKLTVA